MGKAKKKAAAQDDEDWDALLDAEQATQAPPPPPKAAPAAAPPPPAAADDAGDAAVAFLKSMGGGDAVPKKDDKKKKKKGKKPPPKKDAVVEEKKPSKRGAEIAARLAEQKAVEDELAKAKAAQELEIRKLEDAEKLKADEEQRKREEKLARKAAAREEARKNGTYETKKQKEARLAAERRRASMLASGQISTDSKPSRPKFERKKKKVVVEKVVEFVVEPEPEPEVEEEEVVDDWEAVDDWESGDVGANLEKLNVASKAIDEEVEDEAELEVNAEAAKLKEAGRKLKEREKKRKEEEEASAKLLEAEAAEADKVKREALERKLECRQKRLAREKRRDADRSESRLRSPICCIMGHVDTGKTKLLDKIRQTNVQDGEAGGITQQIGATFFDRKTLEEKIRPVATHLQAIQEDAVSYVDAILGPDPDAPRLNLPGLLVIDTPGHEAFSNLRSRGSSLCDMAILVVDLMHGLEPQTLESISMLKRKKTPFVVALNKVDRCYDWKAKEGVSMREALKNQAPNTLAEFEAKKASAFTELNEQSLNVALYWENDDPGSTVSVVPTSAITGEGVPDLLRVVLSLTQQRLAAKLMFGYNLQCTVLEVKVVPGMGATLDVILVNGCLHAGDTMVLCTQDGPIVTTARALLTPPPSRETRIKSDLQKHDSLEGAIGLKITGDPELTKVVPGTGILVVHQDDDVEDLKEECMKDVANLTNSLATEAKGVTVQASTLGALEALLEFLRNPGKDRQGNERPPIPVSSATVGPIHKKDVIKAAIMAQKGAEEFSCILGFDVPVDPEAQAYADKNSVKIFTADIIYHLEGHFTRHLDDIMERKRDEARDVAVFPSLFKINKQHVFNNKEPIILGGEVVEGVLKVGTPLCIPHLDFLDVGIVQSIEVNGKDMVTARKGQECAVKIVNHSNPGMTYGRQFDHNHQLFSKVNRASIDALKKYFKDDMKDADWRLVIKLKKVFSVI